MSTAESLPLFDTYRLMVAMGVSGCGKSTIGDALATKIDAVYVDGDAYHPTGNIEKMSQGIALEDTDRWPWLDIFAREIASREGIIIGGCSALKRIYRQRITKTAGEPVFFIHLDGSQAAIAPRMNLREGHFMPGQLLDSQFAALEPPGSDEAAITVSVDHGSPEQIAQAILLKLRKET